MTPNDALIAGLRARGEAEAAAEIERLVAAANATEAAMTAIIERAPDGFMDELTGIVDGLCAAVDAICDTRPAPTRRSRPG